MVLSIKIIWQTFKILLIKLILYLVLLHLKKTILSPFVSNNKPEMLNNNLLSLHKNSINDLSPFKPMNNSPYTNSKFLGFIIIN